MAKRQWSRKAIVNELIKLYKTEKSLTCTSIDSYLPGLQQVIYYKKKDGNPKYFSSIMDAREAAAKKLEQEGDFESAKGIRAFNKPRKAWNKFSKQDIAQRRQELIDTLNKKIGKGEDVSYRCQQEADRTFVSKCIKAFGKYKNAFEAAGIDYSRHAKHIKKRKQDYLEELIECICSGEDYTGQLLIKKTIRW